MASTLPPDPYAALGVSKNADAATIKSTYRKLVLKCHPDKITGDEALKQQKQDEFVKIQQAYDIVGDEEKRSVYDAEVKLEQLRKEKLARGGNVPHVEVKTAGYGVRTQAPAGASASFDARGPSRYDFPKSSSRAHDDDRHYEERHRRYDTYESAPSKHASSSRTSYKEREPVKAFTRSTTDRSRSDQKKSRDKEERRERSGKYAPYVSMEDESSSGDDKVRFEGSYRRRNEEEEARRQAADARRRADETRRGSYEDVRRHRSSDDDDPRKQKTVHLSNNATEYMQRAKGEADARPSPSRTTSYYPSRRTSERPEPVRRSSARPRDSPSSSGRDRDRDRMPDIVDWAEDDRKPSLSKSTSSPADIHVPSRSAPTRSYTTTDSVRRTDTSPTPSFRRTETAPASSRRKEGRPSGLRNAENADSGYSSSSPPLSYPSVPPSQPSTTRKLYHYSTPGGGVRLSPDDLGEANGHRTVYREPERHPTSSAPLSRPPMGANRTSTTNTSQRTTSVNIPPPPLGRSATFTHSPTRVSEDRGRSRNLFGENGRDTIRQSENMRQPTSYSPERVSYSRKIGPDDIRWAPRGRESDREREFIRPTLSRNATYAGV